MLSVIVLTLASSYVYIPTFKFVFVICDMCKKENNVAFIDQSRTLKVMCANFNMGADVQFDLP